MTAHMSSATYRWVAILMAVVAVLGWGLFFMISTSSASMEDAQRVQIGRLTEERDRLDAELRDQKQRTAELAEIETRLKAAKDNLARTVEATETARSRYEETRSALASTQNALTARRTELASAESAEEQQSQVSERTGTIRKSQPRRNKRSFRRHRRR